MCRSWTFDSHLNRHGMCPAICIFPICCRSPFVSTGRERLPQGPGAILVDCTSSDSIASKYPEWMKRGLSIVTPNKKGFSGDRAVFDAIMSARDSKIAYAYHEATVGAGLVRSSAWRRVFSGSNSCEHLQSCAGCVALAPCRRLPSGPPSLCCRRQVHQRNLQ